LSRRAYFWAEGFTCNPQVITDTLRISPSDANVGRWLIHSQIKDPVAPLDAHIADLLDLVGPHLSILRETVAPLETGINCVDHFAQYQGNGFHLSTQLLQRLADLKLSVDFDLYGSRDS
jgi:hypothetical protein